MGHFGDPGGLVLGSVIAPEVVVVEGDQAVADDDDCRAGGVDGEGPDVAAIHGGGGQRPAHRLDQTVEMGLMRLGGEVGIAGVPHDRVLSDPGAHHAPEMIHDRDPDTLGPEVDPRH